MNVVRDEVEQQARDQPQDDHQDAAAPPPVRLMSDGTPACKSSSSRKKKCSMPQCTKQAKVGGLCMKHGGKVKYRFCNAIGCNNVTQKGGYCKRHYNDFGAAGGAAAKATAGDDGSNKKMRLGGDETYVGEYGGTTSSGNTATNVVPMMM